MTRLLLILAVAPLGALSASPVYADENRHIVYIELAGTIVDDVSTQFRWGVGNERSLRRLVETFARAAEDERVAGVFMELRAPFMSWVSAHEIHEAMRRFRDDSEKPLVTYAESLDTASLYLASASSQLLMAESGMIIVPGFSVELQYMAETMEMLEIEPNLINFGDYKTGNEWATRQSPSDEARAEYEGMLDDFYTHYTEAVASARGLERDDVEAGMNQAILTSADAVAHGFIDGVGYQGDIRDDLENYFDGVDEVRTNYNSVNLHSLEGNSALNFFSMLTQQGQRSARRGRDVARIALIYASGAIVEGESASNLFGGSMIGHLTMIDAIRDAVDDASVKALVLRIDSPGGSALASDLIWAEVMRARDSKPVVVSMGNTAASGGYYIASAADTIFAYPMTITGSIGVLSGKFNIEGMLNQIGIQTTVISRGDNADIFSSARNLTDAQRSILTNMMSFTYNQFVNRVALGRDVDEAEIEALGGGRIYTGLQAEANGLIDELGGLRDALLHAAEAADLVDEPYEILVLPEAATLWDQLASGLSGAQTQSLLQAVPGLRDRASDVLGLMQSFQAQPVAAVMHPFVRIN